MKHSQRCKHSGQRTRAAGFSLVEVLVALIIISVGMLGLAKIQALAYASTGIASGQSIAALQASSLVSAMRANRSYWSTVTPTPFVFNVANGVINTGTLTDAALANNYVCAAGATGTVAPCTPTQIAGNDLNDPLTGWIAGLDAVLPNPTATINCPAPNPAGSPIGCTIQITWLEKNVSINTQSTVAMAAPTYTVYVVP